MPGSVVNVSPLIFSPFVCSLFLCAIVDLPQREMDPSFSGLLGLLQAYLRLLQVFRGAPLLLVLELPEITSARSFQGVLEYGLQYKGRFACCR